MFAKKIGILDPLGNNPNPLNDQPYSDKYKQLAKKWSTFPAYKHVEKLINMIENNQVILIVSSTGSGKTVLLPKLALHVLDYKGHVVVTLPKQLTVDEAAGFAADTMDVQLGKEIGFQYRGADEKGKSELTKILYATDGTVVARLMRDPTLKEFDVVIIDEAHERKVQIDFLLYLLKNALQLRKDLKVIIMSATINSDIFTDYFSKFKFEAFNIVSERIYPIKSIFLEKPITERMYMESGYEVIKNIVKTDDLHSSGSHDILVFVPTVNDTERLCEMINRDKLDIYCVEIYSGVKADKEFIAKDKVKFKEFGKGRKIVTATNVAESSITIDGIKFVIDSGYEMFSSYDPELRARKLEKSLITVAQAKQRMGRAGRTEPGVCYHLYTQNQFDNEMKKFPEPSIRTSNIWGECLRLMNIDVINDAEKLRHIFDKFIEPPRRNYFDSAIVQLRELELIDSNLAISPLGKVVADIGMDPHVCVAIVAGYFYKCYREVLVIFVIIELCRNKLSDLFVKPSREAPENIKSKFRNAVNHFKSSKGDHIAILKMINEFDKHKSKKTGGDNGKQLRQWCYENFLKYDIFDKTFKRFKKIKYRTYDILKGVPNTILDLKISDDIIKEDLSKRVMMAISYGLRFQTAEKLSSDRYYVNHVKNKLMDLDEMSYLKKLKSLPSTIIYTEMFSSVNGISLNILSKNT